MTANNAFKRGDLQSALSLSAQEVKQHPKEPEYRAFFAELCCIAGELDRADQQLNTLFTLNPELMLTVSTWRHLIRSAHNRTATYRQASAPALLCDATESIKNSLSLLVSKTSNDATGITAALANDSNEQTKRKFKINGEIIDTFRDLDDINAGIWEFLSPNGDYYWIDYQQVAKISIAPPKRALDLIWRECQVNLINGDTGTLFLPAIYPDQNSDDMSRLGRSTQWIDNSGCFTGQGLREFLVNDDIATLNSIETVELV